MKEVQEGRETKGSPERGREDERRGNNREQPRVLAGNEMRRQEIEMGT